MEYEIFRSNVQEIIDDNRLYINICQAAEYGSLKGVEHWQSEDPHSVFSQDEAYFCYTPLHYACRNGNKTIVDFLIQHQAAVNAKDSNNTTPLMYAGLNGHFDVVELLLIYGADVNNENLRQQTPLHWAVLGNHLPVVKELLDNDADLDIRDVNAKKPYDMAVFDEERSSIEEYLFSKTLDRYQGLFN